jgi:RNA polymerase sigma factor (sigma-70 family)
MVRVMVGAAELSDAAVRAAVAGADSERARVLEVLEPRVRLMVAARLSPRAGELDTVSEIAQQVLAALVTGLARLENRTADGLKAYVSGIVSHQVAERIGQHAARRATPRAPVSLDTTIGALSQAGPLWQFLSASGTSPSSAAARAEQVAGVITALGCLSDEYREVITLAFFDQLPMREIAQRRGTSQRAASMLLLRAVRTLRRNMTGPSQTR